MVSAGGQQAALDATVARLAAEGGTIQSRTEW
jgi:hypothetical protein